MLSEFPQWEQWMSQGLPVANVPSKLAMWLHSAGSGPHSQARVDTHVLSVAAVALLHIGRKSGGTLSGALWEISPSNPVLGSRMAFAKIQF